jgi:Ni/Co efflux regulator RcnB
MTNNRRTLLVAALALGLGAAPAFAEKGGEGKGKGHNKDKGQEVEKHKEVHKVYFTDSHRGYVTNYYHEEFRGGRCPPGLAKKHNGCMPPGQAKKWRVGAPIPSGVVVYDVPPQLVVRLGPPPSGQKYIRVGADILLISVGSRVVIDAIVI